MTSFQATYLKLLRTQVDEEISFLIRNGHDSETITTPCMFCVQKHIHLGTYRCYRLNELRRFQSSIVQHEVTQHKAAERNTPKARRAIGFDERPVVNGIAGISLNSPANLLDQPLLNLKF